MTKKLEDAVARALADHEGVAAVYLFGSVARGEAGPSSDIDLAVLYGRHVPAAAREAITAALERHVGLAAEHDRVDIVDLASQGPIFAHRVLVDGRRLLVADDRRRIDFESDVLSRALDFRPTWELATRGKPAALRRWLRERHDAGTTPIEARRHQGEPRKAG